MQAMSAIKIKQGMYTQLTNWMGFHIGNVSNQNQAKEVHTTHRLNGFHAAMSAIKIKQRRWTQFTLWGFHTGHVSNQNQAEEVHTTHNLDEISSRQCQQSKSSRRGVHNSLSGWDSMETTSAIKIKQKRCTQLTAWMGFYAGNISNQNQAKEVAHNSLPGWDFMETTSAIKIKQKRCTQLTLWMIFHGDNISNQNQTKEVHTTHSLDGISCRQHQQSKSSKGGAHNSLPGWDFMQAMSTIKIKQRRCTQLTIWMRFHTDNISNQNQAECTQLTVWMGFHAGLEHN